MPAHSYKGFDLGRVPPELVTFAKESIDDGNIEGVLITMESEERLPFLIDNFQALNNSGLFEIALSLAWRGITYNWSHWPLRLVRCLFEEADRKRLLATGDALPHDGPFTVYRGVSGRGNRRRVRGLAWSFSFDTAKWFAERFESLEKPAVYKATVRKEHVYAYFGEETGRNEEELVCKIIKSPELVWSRE